MKKQQVELVPKDGKGNLLVLALAVLVLILVVQHPAEAGRIAQQLGDAIGTAGQALLEFLQDLA